MAAALAVNAKAQRPSVCNALETLLLHRAIAPSLLPSLATRLGEAGALGEVPHEEGPAILERSQRTRRAGGGRDPIVGAVRFAGRSAFRSMIPSLVSA